MPRSRFLLVSLLLPFLALVGCSKSGHNHAAPGGGHVHVAPHGGVLVEIGEHAYNLELLRDPAAGKLTAWVLDGHAENFVRIAAPSIELVALAGGQRRPLSLKAVANAGTGETVGNTSQFEAQADWLKSAGELPGTIESIEIKGTTFRNIASHLKK